MHEISELGDRRGKRRNLLLPLLKREIQARHKGTFGGVYWFIIQNVIMVVIYSTVFGTILKGTWHQQDTGQVNFTIVLFIGLIQYNLFAEILNRSPLLVVQNSNLVTKVVFPLEILSCIVVGVALFNALIAFGVLLVAALLLGVHLSINGFLLPLIVAPLVLMGLGFSWILAAFGTYVRDAGQIVGLGVTAMMFLSPLFYPINNLPVALRMLMELNPITIPMQQARAVLIFGEQPDAVLLGLHWLAALAVALSGRWVFEKMRGGFADVI